MAVRSKWQSLPTEAINPSSLGIDKLQPDELVDLMISEDRKMLAAVQRERERIAVGVEMIASALRKEGRVIFVGAGTSGRAGQPQSAGKSPRTTTKRAHDRSPAFAPPSATSSSASPRAA